MSHYFELPVAACSVIRWEIRAWKSSVTAVGLHIADNSFLPNFIARDGLLYNKSVRVCVVVGRTLSCRDVHCEHYAAQQMSQVHVALFT